MPLLLSPRPPPSPNNSPFTLVMADPDAPSPDAPKARSWLHWIVAGARPGGDVGKRGNGETLVPYAPPTPPRGT